MKADVTAENRPAWAPEKQMNTATDVNVKDTHEDQRGIQVFIVFLHKATVVVVGFTLEFIIELDARAAGGSKEVRKERWQRLEHGILQTGEERHGQPKLLDGGCQPDARFLVYGRFSHDASREVGERTEDRCVLDGLREGKKAKGE